MSLEFSTLIRSHYEDLSKSEKRIADYFLEHTQTASLQSIQELASAADTSVATISRLAKKLGFQNFQELRMSLGRAETQNADSSFFASLDKDDSYLTIASKTFSTNIHSLSATQSVLTEEILKKAIDILSDSRTCAFFGLGGSSVVTLNAYHRFLRTDLNCHYSADFHLQMMQASKMTADDCAMIISHTGKNRDILRIVETLKKNQVPIISITSNASSPLAVESDVVLISISDETNYRPEAVSSMVSQLTLTDSLFMIYAMSTEEQTHNITKVRAAIQQTRINR